MMGADRPVTLCPICRKSGFTQSRAFDGRPRFKCQGCDGTWTSGVTGAPYAGGAQSRESACPRCGHDDRWGPDLVGHTDWQNNQTCACGYTRAAP